MSPLNSFFLITFGILAYLILIDENVAIYLNLIFKLVNIRIQQFFWLIRFHPNNFVTTWIRNRQYDKIAKELEKELRDKM